MKSFKKSLVATAVLASFAGNAVAWEFDGGIPDYDAFTFYDQGTQPINPTDTAGNKLFDGKVLTKGVDFTIVYENDPALKGDYAVIKVGNDYYSIEACNIDACLISEKINDPSQYPWYRPTTLIKKTIHYRGRTTQITFEEGDEAEFNKQKEAFERDVDKTIKRQTKQAVVGAIAVNIIAEETINPALKEHGASVGATVGGGRDHPEVHVGVNKDLSKETGVDGLSANVGVGTQSGNLSAGVSKTVEVNENFRVGVGASVSENGFNVGPYAQVHDGNGNGVGIVGVVPTISVGGYTVVAVPQLFIPNLIVVGAQAFYKWVKAQ